MKPFWAKHSRLTESNSPDLFETSVSTSSETPVTLIISGILASTEEVSQLQEEIRTDPSVMVNTSIPKPAPSRANSEGVTPPVSTTVEVIPSLALEIFYRPNGLSLPPRLIAIEEIVEDLPSSTPLHFGTRIHLYHSTIEVSCFNHPSSQVPVKSLGNLLDRLNVSEQPSTSRTVSFDTVAVEPPATTLTMFTGVPSIPTSSQPLDGVHPRTISTTWSVPICSSGILSGISYVETQQIDPSHQYQFGQSTFQRPIYPLNTRLPPYGGQYAFSLFPPGEQPYESSQQNSGQTGIASSGWVPILPQQPRVVYSMQPIQLVSNIPTTPAIATVSQVQVLTVVCQPQVSQVIIQQPLVSTTQSQPQISDSLIGMTHAQTGTITPHLGQTFSIGQQRMVQQPWLVQYQQPQF